MKKQILMIIFSMVLLVLFMNKIPAPGPNYHLWDLDQSLEDEPDTLIAQIIQDNYDACLCGLEYPDVTIFEYWTNFKVYAGLHNYNVPGELLNLARNDRDRAFAYCWKVHLATDSISHNYFVPAEIEKTKLPNYVIHPVKELKLEGNYLDIRSNHMLENCQEFDSIVEQATGRDWSSERERLSTIIGGGDFYSTAYAPETTTTIGKFENGVYKITKLFVNDESAIDMERLTVEESEKILRGETPSLDPSGEKALANADKDTQLWLYGITILAIFILFYLGFRWNLIGFSKTKFKVR